MRFAIPLTEVAAGDRPLVGEKCFNLSRLREEGFRVPSTLCLTTAAYDSYVDATGLRERIQLELHRRDLDRMRWEELWDAALRIRNMFLRTPLLRGTAAELLAAVEDHLGLTGLVLRSSAPGEDAPGSSFAGLHESFVNVSGKDEILDHLRLVWASLWSDAALLYRRELGLDLEKSSMAVAVQTFLPGESSGVLFTVSPVDRNSLGIEAVHGLNEGLVDGNVEPDRWTVDRSSLRIVDRYGPSRRQTVRPAEQGTSLADLPGEIAGRPPLAEEDVLRLAAAGLQAEDLFQAPQDVEWTIASGRLVLLQSRPITTTAREGEEDLRGWHLSLRRSLASLRDLKKKLETELMPAMQREAALFSEREDTARLSDDRLAEEIRRRSRILEHWQEVYREYCIPFAHGMRLFGQVYNSLLRPRDPYEFVDLLGGEPLESVERNRALGSMAERLRESPDLATALEQGDESALDEPYRQARRTFIRRFGDLSCRVTGGSSCTGEMRTLDLIVLEMSRHPPRGEREGRDRERQASKFIEGYRGGREEAGELLEIARASYRLRDNDNIYLGRIEAGVIAAAREGAQRLERDGASSPGEDDPEGVALALEGAAPGAGGDGRKAPPAPVGTERPGRPRQLVGQPAGPGLGSGPARVVREHADLASFRHGEVLVCDAVDPNMTFVAPLAAAVVERRGGMLIHGAIIAREYGLPCVTGIPGAIDLIRNGDEVTVDGYLGIVTLSPAEAPPSVPPIPPRPIR
jgi:pyruvate,water dikinase